RVLAPVVLTSALVAAGLWVYQGAERRPRSLAYDLAARLPFAARTSEREVIMFGWPDAEPHFIAYQGGRKGFGGDAEFRGREHFIWVRQGAPLRIDVAEPRDRALVFDIEAYQGIEDQSLSITVNGKSLGTQPIPA